MMKSIINRKYGTNIFDWVYFILLLTVNLLLLLFDDKTKLIGIFKLIDLEIDIYCIIQLKRKYGNI